jgi:mRNA interferase HicA
LTTAARTSLLGPSYISGEGLLVRRIFENRTEMFDNRKAKGSEFLRKVKAAAKRKKLAYRWNPERGAGSHGTLYLGDRHTIVKDLKKELGPACWPICAKARHAKGGSLMFNASYPASFLPEANGQRLPSSLPGSPGSAHRRRRP